MKWYQVTKIDSNTGKEINYGVKSEDDMRLITRGYIKDELLPNMYNRAGSKWFFMVTEIIEDF